MENPYGYKMPYVPYANEIVDLNQTDEKKNFSVSAAAVQKSENIDINGLNAVSIDAINSMLSMCSMVYMMCIQKLGGEEPELPFNN